MWFDLDPGDLAFCDRSPRRIVNETVLDLAPLRAFELLTSADEARHWLEDLVAVRWTSPKPHVAAAVPFRRLFARSAANLARYTREREGKGV